MAVGGFGAAASTFPVAAYLSDIVQEPRMTRGTPDRHKKEHDMKLSIRTKLPEWIAIRAHRTPIFAGLIRICPR